MLKAFYRLILFLIFVVSVIGTTFIFCFFYFAQNLPDHEYLQDYVPPQVTRIYSSDLTLYRELANERRIFTPLSQIPPLLIQSFLAAEDKNFFYHVGIDLFGLFRAFVENTLKGKWKESPKGASTITQQVAKNFLVGNERSFVRKIREAIMSLRLENSLKKTRILELYLNQIYLGRGSYGVGAAAYTYFQKPLHQLSLSECAFLASLPKAPSNYNPLKDLNKATQRRNWTLKRLVEEGVITQEQAIIAKEEKLEVKQSPFLTMPSYAAEDIRKELISRFGQTKAYEGGLIVYSTIDTSLQKIAEESLQYGLHLYDRRYEYRGALGTLHENEIQDHNWKENLLKFLKSYKNIPSSRKVDVGIVLNIKENEAKVGLYNGDVITLNPQDDPFLNCEKKNSKTYQDLLKRGDVILTFSTNLDLKKRTLDQIPNVTGGIIVLDADKGEILAMSGGYSPEISQFNCVTQALRQPGSVFKPIVYLTALENGFTPHTMLLDAPIEVSLGPGLGTYAPKNYSKDYLGAVPLKMGIIHSRNLMTVRLAHQIGMKRVKEMAKRLGVYDDLPLQLAMSLGAGETTLLRIAGGYATFVNGGKRIYPHLIRRVHDRLGHLLFQMPPVYDDRLFSQPFLQDHHNAFQQPLFLTDNRKQIIEAEKANMMKEMLKEVAIRGTASRLCEFTKQYPLEIGGKTGTTNDHKDTWFVGFIKFPSGQTWIVGAFVGFQSPKPMGEHETGGKVAMPIFEHFLKNVISLKNIQQKS